VRIRVAPLVVLFACATAPHPRPEVECDPACHATEVCDHTTGRCSADPCLGRCLKTERCRDTADPPTCEIAPLPMSRGANDSSPAQSPLYPYLH
jgi:hypothetical protein